MKAKFILCPALLLFCLLVSNLFPGATTPQSVLAEASQQANAPLNTQPDLVVEKYILDPPNPTAGGTVNITPVIKNTGTVAAGFFNIYVYVNPVDDPPISTTVRTSQFGNGLGLAAGGTFDGFTATNIPVPSGALKIYVWVDPDNRVAETNEDNNLFPQTTVEPPDAFEEDDTCEAAKVVATDGSEQAHNLAYQSGAADADWVKFSGQSGVTYIAEAIAVGANAKLKVELHTKCDGQPSFGTGAKVKFTAPTTGDYFFKVEHIDATYEAPTDYKLKVSTEGGCSASLEPNNACSLPAELLVGSGVQNHNFCEANDVDWVKFETRAGAKYTIQATNVGPKANVQLSLFTNCEGASADSGQRLRFTAASKGYVYLKMQNLDPQLAGSEANYTLAVDYDGNQQGCTEDAGEQDDTQADARAIAIDGAAQTHNACPNGDVDWVKFDAVGGTTYTMETLNLGASADTELCLFDATGKQVVCDDDSGAGKGSRLVQSLIAGTYALRIKDTNPEVAGEAAKYDVQVSTGQGKTDAFEGDNSQAAAKLITPDGTEQTRLIGTPNDADWIVFSGAANTAYIIETISMGEEADTVIELYNAAGNLLARNDDFTPQVNSQLAYQIAAAGNYFIKVQHYNQTIYGAGTEYKVKVRPGTVVPTPTPTATATATPTPTTTPQPSGVRTLILVNRARLAALYSEDEATQVMQKLDTLAAHANVKGEILRLDNNTEVSNAYAGWVADLTNVEKANLVAGEIRRMVMTYLGQRSGIEYVVLVGDDRALPFRRVPDNTPQQTEKTYKDVDASHPTGAALKANYFLTDDFFVDREPTQNRGHEIYIPDLAIGRLIEKPSDMIRTIDAFLANPRTPVNGMLVTGYDFVQDAANSDCNLWKGVITDASKVNCSLIGTNWSKQQFTDLQLRNTSPFNFQSINGHAAHYAEGVAGGGSVSGDEIDQFSMDLSGGLIYSLGCHGGLNVAPTNATKPVDLAEAFVRKGANYVGNTGYGWGMLNSVGLSEKVIQLFTTNLLKGGTTMGKALSKAKTLYYEQDQNFSGYDEKVMQQLIFYGLPMFEVGIPASLGEGDNFPGVGFEVEEGSLGPETDLLSKTVSINFNKVLDPNNPPGGDVADLQSFGTGSGEYLALNGFTNADVDIPVQPLHFGSVTVNDAPARSVVLRSASYDTQNKPDLLVGTAVNEFVPRSDADEAVLADPNSWYPAVPLDVRAHNGTANLFTQLSQYQPATSELRLFSDLAADVYYSTSTDQTAPEIIVVDGLHVTLTQKIEVKVGVIDASGIKEVVISYVTDVRQGQGGIKTQNAQFNASTQKWEGSFTGDGNSRFFVQVVDKAGNLSTDTNKGRFYQPALARAAGVPAGQLLYLPVVQR